MKSLLALAAVLALTACTSLGKDELPVKAPPLIDMDEPVALHEEPKDETVRKALPLGAFTGVTVTEARRTLDETAPHAAGVRVSRVVENSPGDAAGIEEDDLLVAVSARTAASTSSDFMGWLSSASSNTRRPPQSRPTRAGPRRRADRTPSRC